MPVGCRPTRPTRVFFACFCPFFVGRELSCQEKPKIRSDLHDLQQPTRPTPAYNLRLYIHIYLNI